MNKIFKSVYCESTQTWVAIPETAKTGGKKSTKTQEEQVKTLDTFFTNSFRGLALSVVTILTVLGFTHQAFAASVAISQNDGSGNAIKGNATTSADLAVAIGNEANAKGVKGVAIGNKAVAGTTGTAIGDEATANGEGSMALGSFAFVKSTWVKTQANGDFSTAIGGGAVANGQNATAIGAGAKTDGKKQGIAIGDLAQAGVGGVGGQIIAIGSTAVAKGDQSTAIGNNVFTTGNSSIAIGGDDLDSVASKKSVYLKPDNMQTHDEFNSTSVAKKYNELTGQYLVGAPNAKGDAPINGPEVDADEHKVYRDADGKVLLEKIDDTGRVLYKNANNEWVYDDNGTWKVEGTDAVTTVPGTHNTYKKNQYISTESRGEASVVIGVSTLAEGDLSTAVGTKSSSRGFASTAFGVGANADLDNSVALGAGSQTQDTKNHGATTETTASILSSSGEMITYGNFFAGSDYLSSGDQVSFGSFGYERQLKNVAPGAVNAESTDAINGSQLFVIAKSLQDGNSTFFHTNENDPDNQKIGNTASNEGSSRTMAGATGAKAVTAGMESRATGANAVAVGQDSKALNDGTVAIGNNATAGAFLQADIDASQTAIDTATQKLTTEKGTKATLDETVAQKQKILDDLLKKALDSSLPKSERPTPAELTAAKKELKKALADQTKQAQKVNRAERLLKQAEANKVLAETNKSTINEKAQNAVAIGNDSKVIASGGVALGAESLADRKALIVADKNAVTHTPTGEQVFALQTAKDDDKTAIAKTVNGALGAVSVGTADKTRQITHVAAGRDDSDAVNVAQLKSVGNVVDKGFSVSANHRGELREAAQDPELEDSKVKLGGGVLKIIGAMKREGALQRDNSQKTTQGDYSAKNIQTVMLHHANGAGSTQVQIQLADNPEFTSVKAGPITINKGGKITGLSKGEDDTDAVNVSQLKEGLANVKIENQVHLNSNSPFVYTKDIDGVPTQLIRMADEYDTDGNLITRGKFYKADDIGKDGKVKPTAKAVEETDIYTSALGPNGKITEKERVANIKSHLPIDDKGEGKWIGQTPKDNSAVLNDAASVQDVLNAGWNLTHNSDKVDFVKAYDTVNFEDTDTVKFMVTNTDTKVSTIKASLQTTKIEVSDGTKTNLDGTDVANGQVVTPKNPSYLATAGDIAKAINDSGWNVTSGIVGTGIRKKDSANETTELVKSGEKVKLIAGDNLAIEQKGQEFTYSLQDDIKITTIEVGEKNPDGTFKTKPVRINEAGVQMGDKRIAGLKAGVEDTDAVNFGQLKKEVAKVVSKSSLNFRGDNPTTINKPLGSLLDIVGGADKDKLSDKNIGVNAVTIKDANGKDKTALKVQLAKEIKGIDSITFGDAAEPNVVSIGKTGINAGGNRITNVAPGVADSDAATVGQLKQQGARFNAGVALAGAQANLPQPTEPGKRMVSAGAAYHGGAAAVAVGLSGISDAGKVIYKVSGSASTKGSFMIGGGVGYQW